MGSKDIAPLIRNLGTR